MAGLLTGLAALRACPSPLLLRRPLGEELSLEGGVRDWGKRALASTQKL